MFQNDEENVMEVVGADDIEVLRRALIEEERKSEKYLASLQRAQADLSNYIKRAEQEKIEIIEFANRSLVLNLLPVLDDFEMAFNSTPSKLAKSSWTEGMKLIYNKARTVLKTQGLAEIRAVGEAFDPHLHEAVAQRDGEDGIVLEETRKGYKFKDKLLRPSSVVVGKGQEEQAGGETVL